MNLIGMSAGAKVKWIFAGKTTQVEPGYFWCEYFEGTQISVDYRWEGKWVPVSGWEATVDTDNLYMFKKWKRIKHLPDVSWSQLDELVKHNITNINIEFIDGKIIEVHLRHSPDPQYDELIPVWQGSEKNVDVFKELGYVYVASYDDADGFIKRPRSGFMVKNNKGENECF